MDIVETKNLMRGTKMRIKHDRKSSFIQGSVSEEQAIRDWILRAKQIEPSLTIMVDECDEYESSYTVVGYNLTQTERQEAFSLAK